MVVVDAATGRRAVVVVGGGAVVVGAAVVVVGSAVVVVAMDVVVDGSGTGSSVAATSITWRDGATPAGEAPAHVDAPTSTAARSGLATTGLMARARIGRKHITVSVRVKGPSPSCDTASAQVEPNAEGLPYSV